MTVILKCAVLVIGGGSAGVGAAWRAALAAQGGDLREGRAEKVRGALDFERYLDWADKLYR